MKPIALNMTAEIARDAETRGMPISGIGGITTWRDAAEFMALGCGTVQVCTAAMTYGFKIVKEMIDGLERWMDEREHATPAAFVGRASGNVVDWQYLNLNYVTKARIDQDLCIKCGRCHIACEDTSHQAITHMVDGRAPLPGDGRRVRRLQSLRRGVPGGELHHHGEARARHDRSPHRPDRRSGLRQLDDASEQSDGNDQAAIRTRAGRAGAGGMSAPGDNLRINGGRLWDSLMEMAKIGPGVKGGNKRLTLTDEDREGRELFRSVERECGLHGRGRHDGQHVRPPRGDRADAAAGDGRQPPRHAADRRQVRRRARRAVGP